MALVGEKRRGGLLLVALMVAGCVSGCGDDNGYVRVIVEASAPIPVADITKVVLVLNRDGERWDGSVPVADEFDDGWIDFNIVVGPGEDCTLELEVTALDGADASLAEGSKSFEARYGESQTVTVVLDPVS